MKGLTTKKQSKLTGQRSQQKEAVQQQDWQNRCRRSQQQL
jgi:hypothetical protein